MSVLDVQRSQHPDGFRAAPTKPFDQIHHLRIRRPVNERSCVHSNSSFFIHAPGRCLLDLIDTPRLGNIASE
jgi:hypothetical protein